MKKHIITILWSLFVSITAHSQIRPHAEFKVQNMHLCRGLEVASGLVMTTDMTIRDANNHFKAGVWGGAIADGSYKEFNPHVSYSNKGFSVEVFDLFNFSPGATYDTNFFNFRRGKSGHLVDVSLTYTVSERFPLTLNWATLVFGRDRNSDNTKNKYSSYCSVGYTVYRKGDLAVDANVGYGFALQRGGDPSSFYGPKPGFVDISVKVSNVVRFGSYEVPVFANAVLNPLNKKTFMQVGLTIFSF